MTSRSATAYALAFPGRSQMQNLSDNLVPLDEALLRSSCEAIVAGLAERGFAVVEQFLPSQS